MSKLVVSTSVNLNTNNTLSSLISTQVTSSYPLSCQIYMHTNKNYLQKINRIIFQKLFTDKKLYLSVPSMH